MGYSATSTLGFHLFLPYIFCSFQVLVQSIIQSFLMLVCANKLIRLSISVYMIFFNSYFRLVNRTSISTSLKLELYLNVMFSFAEFDGQFYNFGVFSFLQKLAKICLKKGYERGRVYFQPINELIIIEPSSDQSCCSQ